MPSVAVQFCADLKVATAWTSVRNKRQRSVKMLRRTFWTLMLVAIICGLILQLPGTETAYSQGGRTFTPEDRAKRIAIENELQSIAIVERKLMIPMRDGTRIATDVYRPKDTSGTFATACRVI
jgi:predicted acyl esterase